MGSNTNKGALVAAMAAGLFSAALPAVSQAADTDKVHCYGINACAGKGACNTASNACAGKNSCKGKGWMATTEKECKAKGGHVEKDAPMPTPPKK